MSREEISREIREICERAMAAAAERESEYKNDESSVEESNIKINQILLNAKTAPRKSLSVYEQFKSKISACAINSVQYETAMRNLTAILNV